MNKYILTLLSLSVLTVGFATASTNYSFQNPVTQPVTNYIQQPMQYPVNNTIQGNVVMVPAGVNVKAMLTTPISSEYTSPRQTVSLVLSDDFYYGSKLIAPAGSTVYGIFLLSDQ